jgi:uncharacterized protein YggE
VFCSFSFAQGAGNWEYQSKGDVSKSSKSYDEYSNVNGALTNNYYQQASYTYTPSVNDTVIYLDVKALMNVKADTYILILGLSQISDNLETCFTLIDDRIAAFVAEAGISQDDLFVDFVSQTPILSREREKKIFSKKFVEVPKGFEIKKNIHIRYTDRKMADKYLKMAAKNEIYDIIKVEYIVKDHNAVYDTLRTECVSLLNRYLADLTKLGFNVQANYKSIEETNSCTYPLSCYSSFASYMPSNYQSLAGEAEGLNLVNPNQDINVFYSKLPYNNYDIIINPDIVEPAVQFSQSMRIKIVLKKQ